MLYEALLIPELCEEPNGTQIMPPEPNSIILNSAFSVAWIGECHLIIGRESPVHFENYLNKSWIPHSYDVWLEIFCFCFRGHPFTGLPKAGATEQSF